MISILIIIGAYLMGSIPSGVWYSKLFYRQDIRKVGSGNSGATNVGRTYGYQAAAIVAIVDVVKGWLPVLLAQAYAPQNYTLISLTALAAVIGHAYPIFAHFKGGKIVATSIGALLGIQFGLAWVEIILLLLIIYLTNLVSFASILSFSIITLYFLIFVPIIEYKILLVVILLFLIYRHRSNIKRLLDGTERKVKWGRNK